MTHLNVHRPGAFTAVNRTTRVVTPQGFIIQRTYHHGVKVRWTVWKSPLRPSTWAVDAMRRL